MYPEDIVVAEKPLGVQWVRISFNRDDGRGGRGFRHETRLLLLVALKAREWREVEKRTRGGHLKQVTI